MNREIGCNIIATNASSKMNGTAIIALTTLLFVGSGEAQGKDNMILPHETTHSIFISNTQQKKEKKNYSERYKQIARSSWFTEAYRDKSLGEIIQIEE